MQPKQKPPLIWEEEKENILESSSSIEESKVIEPQVLGAPFLYEDRKQEDLLINNAA